MKKVLITVVVIVVIIVAGIAVIKHKQKQLANLAKPAPQPMSFQTAVAAKGSLELLSHQLGEIQPYTRAEISPRVTGHILSIAKREGDPVIKDEIICSIDDRELAEKAAAAMAETAAARQRLAGYESVYGTQQSITERDEKLFNAGAISKEALERSKATLDSAKASVDANKESIKGLDDNAAALSMQKEYTKLKAPFDGVVTKRLAEPGDLAVPGKVVLIIEQKLPLKVTAQVPQEMIKKIEAGTKVYLTDGTGRVEATIARVYPALAKNFMGAIEMDLQQALFGLPTGSSIGVDIITAVVNGTIVPENAVAHTDNGYFIYQVNKEGIVNVKQVDFLGAQNGMAVVKGDLSEGTVVAVAQENRLLTLTEGIKINAGGKQ